jgi:hypothetical protein
VNGVAWSQSNHNPTGCMSQYNVIPERGGPVTSPDASGCRPCPPSSRRSSRRR